SESTGSNRSIPRRGRRSRRSSTRPPTPTRAHEARTSPSTRRSSSRSSRSTDEQGEDPRRATFATRHIEHTALACETQIIPEPPDLLRTQRVLNFVLVLDDLPGPEH